MDTYDIEYTDTDGRAPSIRGLGVGLSPCQT